MQSRGNRENAIVATKGGGATGVHPVDTSKAYILQSVDASLKRLNN